MQFSHSIMTSVAHGLCSKWRFGQFNMWLGWVDQVAAFRLGHIFRNQIWNHLWRWFQIWFEIWFQVRFQIWCVHSDWFNQIWFHPGCDSNLIQARFRLDLAASLNGALVPLANHPNYAPKKTHTCWVGRLVDRTIALLLWNYYCLSNFFWLFFFIW